MPASWRMRRPTADVTPMMITLSGGTGPDAGGMTPIPGQPVQEVAAETKPAPVAPPAPKGARDGGAGTESDAAPKTPPKRIDKPVDKSSTRKPTTGPEVKTGDARADTGGAPIPVRRLDPSGGRRQRRERGDTDYANFCCPTYLSQMVDLIKRNWNENQGAAGQVQVKFTIHRDGTISDVAAGETERHLAARSGIAARAG